MRPRQWIKNLLVFMAPAAAGVLGDWHTTLRVIAAFIVFCVVASGTYLVNDVVDCRVRSVSPGQAAPARGQRGAAARAGPGIGTASSRRPRRRALIGPWGFAVVVATYAGLSIAYSIRLKREPVMELAVVASRFVLRAVAGGVVAQVHLSNWFLVFTSFAALFLVTGKRCAEHARLGLDRGEHRLVLDQYTESFLKSTLTISATVTVASYCLWAFERTGLLAVPHDVGWIELTVVRWCWCPGHLRLLDVGRAASPSSWPCTTTFSRATGCSGSCSWVSASTDDPHGRRLLPAPVRLGPHDAHHDHGQPADRRPVH